MFIPASNLTENGLMSTFGANSGVSLLGKILKIITGIMIKREVKLEK